jgi:FMN phosphatase YigB (HAD superfamily)
MTATVFRNIKAVAFDAYGTLFDVFSVTALCEQLAAQPSAGLTTFWIQRSVGEPSEELGFKATRVVTSISDPAAVLQR